MISSSSLLSPPSLGNQSKDKKKIFKASLSSFVDFGAIKKSDSKSEPAGAGVWTAHWAQLAYTARDLLH